MELAVDLTPSELRDVLSELADRVAPTSLARERTLPVPPTLRPVFPEGGLVRGQIHGCTGHAGTTLALAMVGDALVAGSWMAVVDVPTFGADAANELGVPLERVVRVDAAPEHSRSSGASEAGAQAEREHLDRWFDVVGAAIDGFDVVLTGVPAPLRGERRPAALRSLVARLQRRGTVMVVVGPAGALPIDVACSSDGTWAGLGQGHGLLRRRVLHVTVGGRRRPGSATATIAIEPSSGRLALVPVVSNDAGDVLRLTAG